MKKLLNYINGELIAPHAGNYLDNIEPATGLVYSHIPDSDAQDIEMAVASAKAASAAWANMHYEKRAEIIEKIAAGIEARMEEFIEQTDA
jgi:aminomuconate-semialdehyde/2-hydroxymuconate-6-semialdehyde dehydrogenase